MNDEADEAVKGDDDHGHETRVSPERATNHWLSCTVGLICFIYKYKTTNTKHKYEENTLGGAVPCCPIKLSSPSKQLKNTQRQKAEKYVNSPF